MAVVGVVPTIFLFERSSHDHNTVPTAGHPGQVSGAQDRPDRRHLARRADTSHERRRSSRGSDPHGQVGC